ncbi:MFS transporter [Patescibacteria group bacterium]
MKNKPLLTIFFIVFIDLLGFGLILPLLPFIADHFQANPLQIGILGASYSLFQFISSPILGRLSDRYGRKRLLVLSQIGSMIGFVLLGVANSLPLLFLSRIIDGITGGNISIAQAYIADITTNKDRAKGMGVIGAAFGLGFILGPVAGGLLFQFGFWAPAFFAAFISLLTVISTSLFLKETIDTKKTITSRKTQFSLKEFKNVFSSQPMGILIITFFFINFAFSGLQGMFALWTQVTLNWGPLQNGYIFAYIGVLAVITQLKILPFLISKYGEQNILIASIPIMALGFFFIPFAPMFFGVLLIANALLVVGNSLANPTIQAIASESVDKEDYGGTLGFLQSSASFGRILGPVVAGELFYVVGKDVPFYSSGIVLLATFIFIKTKLRRTK